MKERKSVSPVITTSLFLFIVVISILSLNSTISTYLTEIKPQSELNTGNPESISINRVIGRDLYLSGNTSSIENIFLGNVSCEITFTGDGKMQRVNLTSCLKKSSKGKQELVIITKNSVKSRYIKVEESLKKSLNEPPYFITNSSTSLSLCSKLEGKDPENASLSFSKKSGPSWISLHTNGTFTWKATNSSQNSTSITASLSDTQGASVSKNFIIAVPELTHRKRIEFSINYSHPTSLKDFPILLSEASLPEGIFNSTATQDDGEDIYLSLHPNGSKRLPLEIVRFNKSEGEAELWTNLPEVNQSTSFYLWWDALKTRKQPSPDAPYGSERVWDNGYLAVWHLGNNLSDSSPNGHDLLSNNGAQNISGFIGQGRNFSGDSITLPEISGFSSGYTLSAWSYHRGNTDGDRDSVFDTRGGDHGLLFGDDTSNSFTFWHYDGTWNTLSTAVSEKVWTFWTGTYNGSHQNLFKNDSFVVSQNVGISQVPGAKGHYIGANLNGGSNTFDGIIDELRFQNISRSETWIETEYRNQRKEQEFIESGSVEEEFSC